MTLYNPVLEKALVDYVKNNRAPEELESLQLMRTYRLGELIWYYVRATGQSTDALHDLNTVRVSFWSEVLRAHLNGATIATDVRERYKKVRDLLRSDEEKKRQVGLH
jgi:hypothetical protein